MCEYCDGKLKHVATEVDGEGYFIIMPDDSEYPDEFILDVYQKLEKLDAWLLSFTVPCCPMCGRDLREVAR